MEIRADAIGSLLDNLFLTEIELAAHKIRHNRRVNKKDKVAEEILCKTFIMGIERCREIAQIAFESFKKDGL